MARIRICTAAIILAVILYPSAVAALNSGFEVSQYAHTSWSVSAGPFSGFARSFAQTTDGYLWLATEFGLVRFDGVRFVRWHPSNGQQLPAEFVTKLLASHDGSLWIGTSTGLSRLRDGQLTTYHILDNKRVTALVEDHKGVVWAGTNAGIGASALLCNIKDNQADCAGAGAALGQFVADLFEDADGALWIGAATGLWRWTRDLHTSYRLGDTQQEIHSVIVGQSGHVVVAINREVKEVYDGAVRQLAVKPGGTLLKPTALLHDRDGALWIGTQDEGLYHVRDGKTDHFSRVNGLTGDFVATLFEDREGNVWVSTLNGIDKFRNLTVTTFSTRQGLSSDGVLSVWGQSNGDVLVGTTNGLNRLRQGNVETVARTGQRASDAVLPLFESSDGRVWVSAANRLSYWKDGHFSIAPMPPAQHVDAIVEDADGGLWLSDQDRGLLRVVDARVVETVPWATFQGRVARVMTSASGGGIWLGFFQGGVAHFRDGHVVASFPTSGSEVTSLVRDGDALWVSTRKGLLHVEENVVEVLDSSNGLPCDNVNWTVEDGHGAFWLSLSCGLARIPGADIRSWLSNPAQKVSLTLYGPEDGVTNHTDTGGYSPHVTRSRDGKLWFVTYGGVSVIDPNAVPFNAVAPSVLIESVSADRATYNLATTQRKLQLQPLVRDLGIAYTATSLTIPEKVTFRYKLDGRDDNWIVAGTRREAFYTDLAPGSYHFRVVGANNDGVWSNDGAVLDITIPPAFYQTYWFGSAVGIMGLAALWQLYRLRWRQRELQLNARFEERLDERIRIAQELHDTLLQGLFSISMQLDVALSDLNDQAAKHKFSHILMRMREVIDEGRRTLQGLRARFDVDESVETALARDAKELDGWRSVDVRILVEGSQREMRQGIGIEIYRVAREALSNALRHARATRIDVGIEYGHSAFRIRVVDDGCGIEPATLEQRNGRHWGIVGMRERSKRIGGDFRISTGSHAGTAVELSVPSDLAYKPRNSA